jgi:hypothetical protein
MATRILALLLGLSGGFATHYTLLILGFIHLDRSFTLANIALTAVHVKLRLLLLFLTIRKLRTGEKGNCGLQANKTRWVGEKKAASPPPFPLLMGSA